jgi:hypothetical protein
MKILAEININDGWIEERKDDRTTEKIIAYIKKRVEIPGKVSINFTS